jgi:hypothetical protein
MTRLAADVRCLAACPVPCQALKLTLVLNPSARAQLAAAVAPLAASVTHLYLRYEADEQEHDTDPMEPATVLRLCQALPQLHSLIALSEDSYFSDLSDLLSLHQPTLCSIILAKPDEASRIWVKHLLRACALEQAASARPPLTVQLRLHTAELAAARQLWAQLAARAPKVSQVVVTDSQGRDLLAAPSG